MPFEQMPSGDVTVFHHPDFHHSGLTVLWVAARHYIITRHGGGATVHVTGEDAKRLTAQLSSFAEQAEAKDQFSASFYRTIFELFFEPGLSVKPSATAV